MSHIRSDSSSSAVPFLPGHLLAASENRALGGELRSVFSGPCNTHPDKVGSAVCG